MEEKNLFCTRKLTKLHVCECVFCLTLIQTGCCPVQPVNSISCRGRQRMCFTLWDTSVNKQGWNIIESSTWWNDNSNWNHSSFCFLVQMNSKPNVNDPPVSVLAIFWLDSLHWPEACLTLHLEISSIWYCTFSEITQPLHHWEYFCYGYSHIVCWALQYRYTESSSSGSSFVFEQFFFLWNDLSTHIHSNWPPSSLSHMCQQHLVSSNVHHLKKKHTHTHTSHGFKNSMSVKDMAHLN